MKFYLVNALRQSFKPAVLLLHMQPSSSRSAYAPVNTTYGASVRYALHRLELIGLFTRFYLLFGALAFVNIMSFIIWQFDNTIAEENHLLEFTQTISLAFAAAMQLVLAHQHKTRKLLFTVNIGLAFLFWGVCLREMDINKFGPKAIWSTIEHGIRYATGFALVFSIILVKGNIIPLLKNIKAWITSPVILVVVVGCFAYVISWPFDKELSPISKPFSALYEETLELDASLLFMLAGFLRINNLRVSAKS